MFRKATRAALTALTLLMSPWAVSAQSPVDVAEVLQMRVLPGWREPGGRHIAGLEIRLKSGWHTYWRSAGSLGISPVFNWMGSQNVQSVTPVWPTPQVFYEDAGESYGYADSLVLPLVIETWNFGEPVVLSGRIDLGVCADICIPASVALATELPDPGAVDPDIQAAFSDRPAQLSVDARCDVTSKGPHWQIEAAIPVSPLGGREAVVFEWPGSAAWITDATTRREGNRLFAQAQIVGADRAIERSALRVTVIGARGAIEFMGCRGFETPAN